MVHLIGQKPKDLETAPAPTRAELSDIRPLLDVRNIASKDLARMILRKRIEPQRLRIEDLRRAGECMAEVAPDTIETEPDMREIIQKPERLWFGG